MSTDSLKKQVMPFDSLEIPKEDILMFEEMACIIGSGNGCGCGCGCGCDGEQEPPK